MTEGFISTIQGYSTKDGPGIRSTVFLVGCNLRCAWCSNPELMLDGEKDMVFDVNGTRYTEHVGTRISARQLAEQLARDRIFYEESGGGVTFSGGEPALQVEFVRETAGLLKGMGISCALDTAGDVPYEVLEDLSKVMDLFLFDLKAFDPSMHKRCTGVTNERIISNVKRLAEQGQSLIIRLVVVPGYNDAAEDLKNRLRLVKSLGESVKRVDVLPYHTLGAGKYQRLGLHYPIASDLKVTAECLEEIRALAAKTGVTIQIESVA